jgi:hypothetical protein
LTKLDVSEFAQNQGFTVSDAQLEIDKLTTSASMTPVFSQLFRHQFNLGDKSTDQAINEAIFDYITDKKSRAEISRKLPISVQAAREEAFREAHGYSKDIDENFSEACKIFNRDRDFVNEQKEALDSVILMVKEVQRKLEKSLQEKWDFFYDLVKQKKIHEEEATLKARMEWKRMTKAERIALDNNVNLVIQKHVAEARRNFNAESKADAEFQKKLRILVDEIRVRESGEISRKIDHFFLEIESLQEYEKSLQKIRETIERILGQRS